MRSLQHKDTNAVAVRAITVQVVSSTTKPIAKTLNANKNMLANLQSYNRWISPRKVKRLQREKQVNVNLSIPHLNDYLYGMDFDYNTKQQSWTIRSKSVFAKYLKVKSQKQKERHPPSKTLTGWMRMTLPSGPLTVWRISRGSTFTS